MCTLSSHYVRVDSVFSVFLPPPKNMHVGGLMPQNCPQVKTSVCMVLCCGLVSNLRCIPEKVHIVFWHRFQSHQDSTIKWLMNMNERSVWLAIACMQNHPLKWQYIFSVNTGTSILTDKAFCVLCPVEVWETLPDFSSWLKHKVNSWLYPMSMAMLYCFACWSSLPQRICHSRLSRDLSQPKWSG